MPELRGPSNIKTSRPEATRAFDPFTALLATVAGGGALFALTTPLWNPDASWGALSPWLEYLAGVALLAAGVTAALRRSGRSIGRLMLIGSIALFVPYVGNFRNEWAFTLSYLTFSWWLPIGAHIALAYPEGRLRSRFDRLIVLVGYIWTFAITTLQMTAFDQERLGLCTSNCIQNLLLVEHNPELLDVLAQAGTWAALVIGMPILAILATRVVRATPPERRVLTPFLVTLGIAVVLVLVSNVAYMLWPDDVGLEESIYNLSNISLILLPFGLLFGLLRAVIARSAAANLLYRIGRGNTPAEIERDVAWALGDPSARLAIRAGADSAFLDSSGRPVELGDSPTQAVTIVGETDDGAVAIVHDPSLRRDQPELLEVVSGATRLAIDNRRLRAEVQLVRDIPSGLAERLLREGARIGDTQALTISVVMSDVRGYTTIAEHGDAHALAAQLNDHRAAMNREISERGGTVMQFVGDAVFAVFGAPTLLPGHALRAVDAAIAMQLAQEAINEQWAASGHAPFELGIGVTTGPVAAALLGSPEHVEYSVVGDVVNLAQRIQSMANAGEVVVMDATYSSLGGVIRAEELPPTMVKGRDTPVIAHRIRAADMRPRDTNDQALRPLVAGW